MKEFIPQAINAGYSAIIVRKQRNVRNPDFLGDLDKTTNKFHGMVKKACDELNKNITLYNKLSQLIKKYNENDQKIPANVKTVYDRLVEYRSNMIKMGILPSQLTGSVRITKEKEALNYGGDASFCDSMAENEIIRLGLESGLINF